MNYEEYEDFDPAMYEDQETEENYDYEDEDFQY